MTSPVSPSETIAKAMEGVEQSRLAIRTGGSNTAYAYTEADDDGDYLTVEDAKRIIAPLALKLEAVEREIDRLRANLDASQEMHLSAIRRNCIFRDALEKISSPTQTEGLLWWQVEARAALASAKTASGAPNEADPRALIQGENNEQ